MSPPQTRVASSLVFSGVVIVVMIALGRITGFAREAVLVGLFGLTGEADIAVLSLTLPDLLVGLLISGGLSAALIPEFKARGDDAGALFWQASFLAAVTGLLVSMSIVWWSDGWATMLAPGLEPRAAAGVRDAFCVVAWAIPMAALSGVSTAYLNSQERFALAAAGTLIFNGVVIAGLLMSLWVPFAPLTMLTGAVLVASMARWFPQLVVASSISGFRAGPEWLISGGLLRRYTYGVAASSALVLLPLVARALASLGETGTIAAVNLSIKLVDLPLGAAIAVLPTLFLPRLSARFLDPAMREEGYALFTSVLRLGIALIVAVTVPALLFMPALIQLLLGHGQMDPGEVSRVARLGRLAFCYFPFQALILIIAVGFNARLDTWIPMVINGTVLLVFLFLGMSLVGVLGEDGIMLGLIGAYAVSAGLSLLCFGVRYRFNLLSRLVTCDFLMALVAAMAISGFAAWLAVWLPQDRIITRSVFAMALGGMLLAIMLAGSPEVRGWIRRALGRE